MARMFSRAMIGADRGLDGHLELLARDELAQLRVISVP
jgi:hypothetical protein